METPSNGCPSGIMISNMKCPKKLREKKTHEFYRIFIEKCYLKRRCPSWSDFDEKSRRGESDWQMNNASIFIDEIE